MKLIEMGAPRERVVERGQGRCRSEVTKKKTEGTVLASGHSRARRRGEGTGSVVARGLRGRRSEGREGAEGVS